MLASLLKASHFALTFNLLEIGARPIGGAREPFHRLLKIFPTSRLTAFELEADLCAKLNRDAAPGIRYYACALGRTIEKRLLYETAHPMCTSLYEPDERYPDAFNNLEEMRLVRTREVQTQSLDGFVRDNSIGPIDFIKIDIQGAELEVLSGAEETLRSVSSLVCEVEFVALYKGQPLFGDVAAHVRSRGFMLHKFEGMAGRTMRPLAAHGSPNYPVQFLWTDALFTRDLFALDTLNDEQLLKLAVILDLYESKDVAHHALRLFDERSGKDLAAHYLKILESRGEWKAHAQKQ